jgi:hypothetical protein
MASRREFNIHYSFICLKKIESRETIPFEEQKGEMSYACPGEKYQEGNISCYFRFTCILLKVQTTYILNDTQEI